MKQMLRDIKAAWPRERRFTRRGWVLLGVFAIVAIAAWRGWDPVLRFQSWFDAIDHDWQWFVTLRVLMWTWIENVGYTPSILTMGGVFVALLLRRPPIRCWWFAPLLAMAVIGGWARVTLYQSIQSALGWSPLAREIVSIAIISLIWGAVLAGILRSWAALALLPLASACALGIYLLLDGARKSNPEFLMVIWARLAVGPEQFIYQGMIWIGLTLIALRSWRIPPDHLCKSCNYDRRGLSPNAPCPECGTATASTPSIPPAPR